MSFELLRNFYSSVLGQETSYGLYSRIASLWDFLGDDKKSASERMLLQIGYGFPYLRFFGACERVLGAVPVGLGEVGDLDFGDGNLHCLVGDDLPFGDMLFDNVLMLHGLEFADDAGVMLAEVHRVLNGGGRLLLVVPKRFGIGSGLPFVGRRFAVREIRGLLTGSGFRVEGCYYGLGGIRGFLFGSFLVLDCVRVADDGAQRVRVKSRRRFAPSYA